MYAVISRLSLLLLAVFLFSCKGEQIGSSTRLNIRGVVISDSGLPVPGAAVSAHGKSATADDNGLFSLENVQVPSDRGVISVSANGFFAGVRGFIPGKNDQSLTVTLATKTTVADFPAGTGGTATLPGGASVDIPASGVSTASGSAYSGQVEVAMIHLDPTSADFAEMVAGNDLIAERTNGDEATLYTYGILRVELSDPSGNELQMATGKTATIEVPVPASMAGNAPATIPLWYLDEETGIWMEEGEATLSGNKYVGTVAHFTDWNCDHPEGTGTVTGRLLDCNGQPIPNLTLNVGQGTTVTDSDGNFSRRVPSNTDFQITPAGGVVSFTPVNVSSLTEGQSKAVGNIAAGCITQIEINLSDCQGRSVDFTMLTASWSQGGTQIFTEKTSLLMAVPPNTSIILSGVTLDGRRGNASVTSGAVGTTTVVDLSMCDGVVLSPTSFTISGSIFNGRVVNIVPVQVFSFSSALSIYTISDDKTDITIVGTTAYNLITFTSIPGKTTGSFQFGGGSSIDASASFRDKVGTDSVYVSLSSVQSGTLQISEYGQVGDRVKGSFTMVMNGEYTDLSFTTSTPITNLTVTGTFEALRSPDEN